MILPSRLPSAAPEVITILSSYCEIRLDERRDDGELTAEGIHDSDDEEQEFSEEKNGDFKGKRCGDALGGSPTRSQTPFVMATPRAVDEFSSSEVVHEGVLVEVEDRVIILLLPEKQNKHLFFVLQEDSIALY